MPINYSLKKWYIKICRYLFNQKFMKIMGGPLKGYQWTTGSSYEYLLGNYERGIADFDSSFVFNTEYRRSKSVSKYLVFWLYNVSKTNCICKAFLSAFKNEPIPSANVIKPALSCFIKATLLNTNEALMA